MDIQMQKYIPEGWIREQQSFDLEQLKCAKENGTIIQGFVNDCDDDFNLHINLGESIVGIIPRNEIDALSVDEFGMPKQSICKNKVNQFVQFKIKEIYDENNLLLSRKDAEKDAIDWVKTDLQPGMVVNGIVKNMRKYGVFVDIGGGVTGLLHIEDISISRIKSPEERFFNGQKIKVMIKYIDKEKSQVVLSHKELLGDWEDNIQNYKEKMIVEGTVKETDQYKNGIFIELNPNLVGLAEYKSGLKYGQKVNVYIKKIVKEKKKIKLLIV